MVKRVKWNDLPQPVRERLAKMLMAEGHPSLVRWFKGGRDWPIVKGVFAALVLGAAVYVMAWLFDEDSRKDPWFDREIWFLLAGLLWVGFVAAIGLVFRFVWKPPEWKWGARLISGGYAACIERDEVFVLPLVNMGTPTITDVLRNGSYQYSRLNFSVGNVTVNDMRFTFIFNSQEEAKQLLRELAAARPVFAGALERRDARALSEIDPFAECTLEDKWTAPSAGGPLVPTPPGSMKLVRWLGSLALAGLIAGVYFSVMKSRCADNPECSSLSRSR